MTSPLQAEALEAPVAADRLLAAETPTYAELGAALHERLPHPSKVMRTR